MFAVSLASTCLGGILPFSSHLRAQSRAAPPPSYEVISVKLDPNGDPNRNITWDQTPDGLMATNVTLELFIRQAYGLMSYQIAGAPNWSDQREFDVSAKMDEAESRKLRSLGKADATIERQRMLQSLIADRFRLVVHRETKQGSVYALVVAKNGPKFQQTSADSASPNDAATAASSVAPRNPPILMGGGLLTFDGAPIAALAKFISQVIGRPVLDRTGLAGKYAFTLKWTSDEFDLPAHDQSAPNQQTAGADESATSIFTVLQEQLGLKLETTKGPVDMLVIDHVEEPTPN
jgi:uncharacterized protein (TIGR03435 family)